MGTDLNLAAYARHAIDVVHVPSKSLILVVMHTYSL